MLLQVECLNDLNLGEIMKLSKQYTKNSRNKLYGCYLSYRMKHNVTFEEYMVLHEEQIAKTNKVVWLK